MLTSEASGRRVYLHRLAELFTARCGNGWWTRPRRRCSRSEVFLTRRGNSLQRVDSSTLSLAGTASLAVPLSTASPAVRLCPPSPPSHHHQTHPHPHPHISPAVVSVAPSAAASVLAPSLPPPPPLPTPLPPPPPPSPLFRRESRTRAEIRQTSVARPHRSILRPSCPRHRPPEPHCCHPLVRPAQVRSVEAARCLSDPRPVLGCIPFPSAALAFTRCLEGTVRRHARALSSHNRTAPGASSHDSQNRTAGTGSQGRARGLTGGGAKP